MASGVGAEPPGWPTPSAASVPRAIPPLGRPGHRWNGREGPGEPFTPLSHQLPPGLVVVVVVGGVDGSVRGSVGGMFTKPQLVGLPTAPASGSTA